MFAEELKGNTSKKRQEEARQRRRKLKQQQQKSAARATQTSTSAASQKDDNEKTTESGKDVSLAQTVSTIVPPKPASSAVANALEQRQLRQEAQLRQRSATKIQSLFRAFKSNHALVQREREILKQRLTDLSTLRSLLAKAGKTPVYAPPPATATSMIRQILFLTRIIPFERTDNVEEVLVRSSLEIESLNKMIEYVIMPGIRSKDGELDPIIPWFESPEGRIRFLRLLRLCLGIATTRSIDPENLMAIDIFLRSMLGVTSPDNKFRAREAIIRIARAMLLPIYPSLAEATKSVTSTSKVSSTKRNALHGPSLDLIQLLRRHLLFNTGSGPIPANAESMRQSCIPTKERTHADLIFNLAVDAVLAAPAGSEARRLQSRLVAEILTIPLLSWKLSAKSISKLLASPSVTGGSRRSLSSRRSELLVVFTSAFVEQHSATLSAGKIVSLLPKLDVPLAICPAPPVQCLLANLIQIGRICPSINGSNSNKIDYQAGAFYFNFIATLIDAIPLGTFLSRESAVEWVSDGSSHTPVVLSPVIIQQCKLLLVDSFVRDLFACAVDKSSLDTDRILREKNDKDLKHEKNLAEVGGSSAASLAAKEARINRTKGFWQSSKWARKLSEGVNKILSSENSSDTRKPGSKVKGTDALVNTSTVSRKLARGKANDSSVTRAVLASNESDKTGPESEERPAFSPVFLFALCRAYGIILARWGGGGKGDIVKRVTGETRQGGMEEKKENATATADPCTLSLLNVVSFSSDIVQALWSIIQSDAKVVSNIYSVIEPEKSKHPIRSLKIRPHYSDSGVQNQVDNDIGATVLYFFLSIFAHVLIVTDDCEIHDMDRPLPLHQLRRCIQLLKRLLYRACCLDDVSADGGLVESNYFGLSLIFSSSRTMRDLYDRSSRRPLAVPKLFVIDDLLEKDLRKCKNHDDYVALLSAPVLRVCPFLVSFKRRLRVFERIVTTSRVEIQGSNEGYNLKPGIPVRITRGRVLEDGLLTLNKLGKDLRRRISVQYINEAGAQESGVDVGGLFKEFWADLSAIAFDPNWALFKVTEGAGNCLYPNPASRAAHGLDHIMLFEFLGRILGKALYEGITIHPQFAHFFLSFLRGDYNFLHMLSDLSTIDPQLYNNLMFLKTYDGDAEDLCLTFTVANDDFGGKKEVYLLPNGSDVMVTNLNKQRYIGLVAKHHVCDRLREQSEAFTRGLWEVIDRSWLRLFNEPELQVLISGSSDGKIDIEDMRSNTRYIGGYTGLDRTVNRFWNVVKSLSSKQQGDLLRFVTSCERPPPLGFASMNPPFTIQRVGILRDGDKLPSASTCFNTLKLPTYSSEKVLKQRLIYSIESGAGFEMT